MKKEELTDLARALGFSLPESFVRACIEFNFLGRFDWIRRPSEWTRLDPEGDLTGWMEKHPTKGPDEPKGLVIGTGVGGETYCLLSDDGAKLKDTLFMWNHGPGFERLARSALEHPDLLEEVANALLAES